MLTHNLLQGFSKLTAEEKSKLIAKLSLQPEVFLQDLQQHACNSEEYQKQYLQFSENTISNYHLPFSIAPNFIINNKLFHIPMVTEESSVVAAASAAAKFWSDKGGFNCEVQDTVKTGQIHFTWTGEPDRLQILFNAERIHILNKLKGVTASMEQRGGGIKEMKLAHLPDILPNYYQINVSFETVDSMGANFINTVLEQLAEEWMVLLQVQDSFPDDLKSCDIIMRILSNYTPQCVVKCSVQTAITNLHGAVNGMDGYQFTEKFRKAITIAKADRNRAVTHNKGIMNGVDAVVVATGNDFRAIEANAHAYASRNGMYSSLSVVSCVNDVFNFSLEIPLALGTVGGLTQLHPMAKHAIDILGNPNAKQLMMITAAVGLASNFSALRALVSTGIQAGHMKLHLNNITTQLGASTHEFEKVREHFTDKTVSYVAVKQYIAKLREENERI